ncbi:hypothetical protein CPB86DRAFT_282955 [Serendipita vermifera]|nr:hypothetical protein CPB86DRAFT_282955 [Serendipita vermifera]
MQFKTMEQLEKLPVKKWWDVDEATLQEQLKNVKVLFLRDGSTDSKQIFNAATSIRALYTSFSAMSLELVLLHATGAENLTHIALNSVSCQSFFEFYFRAEHLLQHRTFNKGCFSHRMIPRWKMRLFQNRVGAPGAPTRSWDTGLKAANSCYNRREEGTKVIAVIENFILSP